MQLKPMHDWAVIKPSDAEEITASGLYIPETAKDKPHEGTVVGIGPGAYEEEKYGKKIEEGKKRKFIPTTIKPGDLVLYEQYAGQTYTIDGEALILVRERNILGVILEKAVRSIEKPKPLQIPAVTTSSSSTMLAKRPSTPLIKTQEKPAQKTTKKPSVKPTTKKKTAEKAVKKAGKKPTLKKVKLSGGKGPGKPKPASRTTAPKRSPKKSGKRK